MYEDEIFSYAREEEVVVVNKLLCIEKLGGEQVTKRYLEGLETENILELASRSSPLMNL